MSKVQRNKYKNNNFLVIISKTFPDKRSRFFSTVLLRISENFIKVYVLEITRCYPPNRSMLKLSIMYIFLVHSQYSQQAIFQDSSGVLRRLLNLAT